jgi:hypothetical protein
MAVLLPEKVGKRVVIQEHGLDNIDNYRLGTKSKIESRVKRLKG